MGLFTKSHKNISNNETNNINNRNDRSREINTLKTARPSFGFEYDNRSSDNQLPTLLNNGIVRSVTQTPTGYYFTETVNPSDAVPTHIPAPTHTPVPTQAVYQQQYLQPQDMKRIGSASSRRSSSSSRSRTFSPPPTGVRISHNTFYQDTSAIASDDGYQFIIQPSSRNASRRSSNKSQRPNSPVLPYPTGATEFILPPEILSKNTSPLSLLPHSPMSSPRNGPIHKVSSIENLHLNTPNQITPPRVSQNKPSSEALNRMTPITSISAIMSEPVTNRDLNTMLGRSTGINSSKYARRRPQYNSNVDPNAPPRIPIISSCFDIIDGFENVPVQYRTLIKALVVIYLFYEIKSILGWFTG